METVAIKCRDLMVGDWVADRYGYQAQITYVGIEYANLENDEVSPCRLDDKYYLPKPIPLTPEILEKNEFHLELSSNEKTLYSCILGTEDRCLVIFLLIDNEKWKLDIKNYYLKKYINFISFHNTLYVHEFQHALRLCGLNELADNFKV